MPFRVRLQDGVRLTLLLTPTRSEAPALACATRNRGKTSLIRVSPPRGLASRRFISGFLERPTLAYGSIGVFLDKRPSVSADSPYSRPRFLTSRISCFITHDDACETRVLQAIENISSLVGI